MNSGRWTCLPQVAHTTLNPSIEMNVEMLSTLHIDWFLKAGANVNITDQRGETSLFYAVRRKSVQSVALLLDAGADVNMKDGESQTALFGGVRNGSVKCVDLLLKGGADVNVTDDSGNTILHQTMQSLKGAKKVLQEGIIVNIRNSCGFNALTHLLENFGKDPFLSMWKIVPKEKCAMLLFAAGETVAKTKVKNVPDYLKTSADINLMNICRDAIRNHLLQMDHVNLIYKVQCLGLPSLMTSYLLYDVTLDEEEG